MTNIRLAEIFLMEQLGGAYMVSKILAAANIPGFESSLARELRRRSKRNKRDIKTTTHCVRKTEIMLASGRKAAAYYWGADDRN